jgi:hypothetical protein
MLLITVMALLNIRAVNLMLENVSLKVDRYSCEKMADSYIGQPKEEEEEVGGGDNRFKSDFNSEDNPSSDADDGDFKAKKRGRQARRNEATARCVLLACAAMQNHKFSVLAVLRVVAGVVMLAVFIISWLL